MGMRTGRLGAAEILFVDDEPHVLAGLRRAMHSHRESWELHWAEGGPAALEHMAHHHVDILVTDMRMPGMDGAALLEEVRLRYPDTARIILSGHAVQASIIAAAGAAQQFLAKPCDPATLAMALEMTLATRAVIEDPQLRSIFGQLENLPKPPTIYAELSAMAGDPRTGVSEIAELLERDVAAATELLKLVNSSFFGVPYEVTTVKQAVILLGVDVIQAVVLAGRVFRPTRDLPPELVASDIADRALAASLRVRRACAAEGWDKELTDRLGLAALLHDVGVLVLATNDPDGWVRYRRLQRRLPAREAQLEAFGVTTGQASAYLLGLWGFHPTIVGTLAEQPLELTDDLARSEASRGAVLVAEAHGGAAATVTEEALTA